MSGKERGTSCGRQRGGTLRALPPQQSFPTGIMEQTDLSEGLGSWQMPAMRMWSWVCNEVRRALSYLSSRGHVTFKTLLGTQHHHVLFNYKGSGMMTLVL